MQKTGGDSTPTIYWGAGTLAESDTSGNLTSEYVFVNGRRIARRDVSSGNVYYLFADMLGSSNVVASSAGALENESQFYPYGGERVVTQNLTNQKYKFEGKERDTESGLDNFGARFDSSATGRFMSPDWANKPEPVPYAKLGSPQTLNLYAFAGNNPKSDPDLDGHEMETAPLPSSCDGNGGLCSSIRDSVSEGGSIQDGVAAYDNSLPKGKSTGSPKTQNGTQAQKKRASPPVVVAADPPTSDVKTGVNTDREVTYRAHTVNKDGSLGAVVNGEINLRETVLNATPGSKPHTCTPSCEGSTPYFEDSQGVGNGQFLDVKRVWTFNRRPVPVWDPVQGTPAKSETLHEDCGNDPKRGNYRMTYEYPW